MSLKVHFGVCAIMESMSLSSYPLPSSSKTWSLRKLEDVAILLFLGGTEKVLKFDTFLYVSVLNNIILLNSVANPWKITISHLFRTKYKCVKTFAGDFFVIIANKESSSSLAGHTPRDELAFNTHVFILESNSFHGFLFWDSL